MTGGGAVRFRAVCSCGWRGPVRVDPNDADTFGDAHAYRHPRRGHAVEVVMVERGDR